jgi:DNA-3-methyladenine glycosylase I
MDANAHDDKTRCVWPGADPLYRAYHDEEWGAPEYDDQALFEKLILDGFQAGLAWITILRKRDAFREAFAGFDPEKIARFKPAKVEALMQNAGIIRNRAKIESAVVSARAYLKIQEGQGFSNYIWSFVDGAPVENVFRHQSEIPAQTELSAKMSKDLKSKGFNFCGPTIIYAFCQATGLVNDHLVSCFRHAECAHLAKRK